MPRKLKIYGGLTSNARTASRNGGRQIRTIVCAESWKRVVALLRITKADPSATLYSCTNYWSESGNTRELAAACDEKMVLHEGVWIQFGGQDEHNAPYVPFDKRGWRCQFCEHCSPAEAWKDDKCPACDRKYDAILAQEGDD